MNCQLTSRCKCPAVLAPVLALLCFAAFASLASAQGLVLRDIFDPALGQHWQLRLNPNHPEGPRQMVLLNPRVSTDARAASSALPAAARPAVPPSTPASQFVIRAGDRITVDQDSERVHARLQAVALESAAPGQTIRVRLRATGSGAPDFSAPVISAVVVSAGVARWPASTGGWR